jgi:GT2 family glycosyltransferase
MKPEIVVQDFCGWHNGEFEQGRSRVIEGGSWKRQRIVMVIPAGASIPSKVALALWNLSLPPNNPVMRVLAIGLEVGEAYSNAVEGILAEPSLADWEYMLTVEHDNLPRPNSLLKLLARMEAHPEIHAISGLYFQKGEGGWPQIWGDPKDPIRNFRPQPPVNGELVECCAIGMGFTLWRLSMFRDARLRRPWFQTQREPMMSQDLFFWDDAREHGYRCAVSCDVKIGHMDENGFIW